MMSNADRNQLVDEIEVFSDGDVDPETLLDAMDRKDEIHPSPAGRARPAWQRLGDWHEQRWMREQLEDWDDWELD